MMILVANKVGPQISHSLSSPIIFSQIFYLWLNLDAYNVVAGPDLQDVLERKGGVRVQTNPAAGAGARSYDLQRRTCPQEIDP